jgi:hypothetical protein
MDAYGNDARWAGCRGMGVCDFYSFENGKVTQKDSYWKIVE